jgi:hypothetical protein
MWLERAIIPNSSKELTPMRRFSLATSLLLAAVLALGFAPLWGFVASTLVEWALPSKPRSSSFMIRPDGTPLLMQMDPANHSYVLTDMNGQPVDDNVSDASLPWVNLASLGSEHRSEHTWRQRIREFSDLRSRPTHWYAISNGQPQGRIYFVGYDVASKYRVGFIAKDGFRESPPPPEDCFLLCGNGGAIDDCVASLQPNRTYNRWGNTAYSISAGGESKDFNPWQLYVLGGEQKLYQIDLRTRTVNVVFTAPHLESCGLYAKDSKSPTWLIVRTDREVLMLNGQHKVERTYTIPAELASRSFRWAEVAPNQALATWTKYSLTVTEYGAEAVVWFDQTGQITRRETGPAQTIARLNTTISLACPIFVVITLVVTCIYPFELVGKGLTNSWSIAQGVVLQETERFGRSSCSWADCQFGWPIVSAIVGRCSIVAPSAALKFRAIEKRVRHVGRIFPCPSGKDLRFWPSDCRPTAARFLHAEPGKVRQNHGRLDNLPGDCWRDRSGRRSAVIQFGDCRSSEPVAACRVARARRARPGSAEEDCRTNQAE